MQSKLTLRFIDMNQDEQESLWVRCPICKGKTRTKAFAETVLLNFPLYCPKCKNESVVSVLKLKMIVCDTVLT